MTRKMPKKPIFEPIKELLQNKQKCPQTAKLSDSWAFYIFSDKGTKKANSHLSILQENKIHYFKNNELNNALTATDILLFNSSSNFKL